jgi:phosphate transport system permease protein
MHLGFSIYHSAFKSQNSEAARPLVFTITLLLIVLITILNLTAIGVRARLKRKYATSAF